MVVLGCIPASQTKMQVSIITRSLTENYPIEITP